MNEEEFLKEHPSLKGKTIYAMIRDEYWWVSGIEDIHKTQLDKAKVREAIDKHSHSIDQGEIIDRIAFLKELGLE